MKVVILTEGGKNIGFGHITRCISLYQAFEYYGITPKFCVNGCKKTIDFLERKNYKLYNWIEHKNELFADLYKTDIVVIDSYLANKSLYNKISRYLDGGILVMIDDYKRMEYPGGIVVNPSVYGDKLKYTQKKGITYLLGKNYIILRKEFWNVPKKKINKRIKNMLITFGGMIHPGLMRKLEQHFRRFNVYLIEPNKNRFTAKEMLKLMLKADICISGGGQTTYELARAGVPTIGICFADNQEFNLQIWQRKKFIDYVGWYKNKSLLKKITSAVDRFMSHEERIKRSVIGRKYVDGKGAKRIVSGLIERFGLNKGLLK
ncbi:MAG: UDP-2,4-diacetamido-2,4,6-trideoxy-beta-L-altropyranose hydrolase [Elusimicrobia bacterium]|nr:UDP-2,4-diacetamido-2,4,6-trideoxy-beta-L-altropyranose hydrolase [Elusimicrobiota bacterium]